MRLSFMAYETITAPKAIIDNGMIVNKLKKDWESLREMFAHALESATAADHIIHVMPKISRIDGITSGTPVKYLLTMLWYFRAKL